MPLSSQNFSEDIRNLEIRRYMRKRYHLNFQSVSKKSEIYYAIYIYIATASTSCCEEKNPQLEEPKDCDHNNLLLALTGDRNQIGSLA